jgi:hypothetical protein
MYPLRSELARKEQRFATSCGLPSLLSAILFFISFKILSGTACTIGVAMKPVLKHEIDLENKHFSTPFHQK